MPDHLIAAAIIIPCLVAGCSDKSSPRISQEEASKAAFACSVSKARDYARSSREPADLVAKSAFHACYPLWETLVQAQCDDTGLCYDNPIFKAHLARVKEQAWIESETPDVLETRAKK